MTATPEQRSLAARANVLARWKNEDPHANAVRGQSGLVAKFEREARERDPSITDAEAARRGMCAYREHMARLALASLKARRAKAAARKAS